VRVRIQQFARLVIKQFVAFDSSIRPCFYIYLKVFLVLYLQPVRVGAYVYRVIYVIVIEKIMHGLKPRQFSDLTFIIEQAE
jgi:hypothetical protein